MAPSTLLGDQPAAAPRDTEADYRELVENASDLIYTHDLDGRFTSVNGAVEKITGYTREEALKLDIYSVVPPERVEQVRKGLERSLSAELQRFDLTIVAKDGRLVQLELTSRLVYRGYRPAFVQGIARDVSERRNSERALQASEEKFRGLVEQSIVGIYIIQGNKFVYANPKFAEIFGYAQEEIARGMPVEELTWHEDRALVLEHLRRRFAGETESVHYTFRGQRKDGSPVEVEAHGARKQLGSGVAVIGTLLDITERRRVESAMRASEARYALAALGSNDGLWDWDLIANRIYLSERWKEQLGFGDVDVGDDPDGWFGRVHPDDRERFFSDLTAHLEGRTPHFETEHRIRHADGTFRWMLVRGMAVRDAGRASRMAGSQTDITERKLAEEKLLHDALHDALTGLPNRSLFMDRLGQAMAFQKRRADYRFAVLFLDVDRFKTINESLGHIHGDRLLSLVSRRLLKCVKPGDTVARLGGDEFTVLLEDYADPDEPMRTAERIHQELAASHDLDGIEVFATASIGIAVGSPSYSKPEEMLRDADTAMYSAKDQGRARHASFHPSMHALARAQLQLETDLRRALDRGELKLTYQPVVSLATGTVSGCEALVVWEHPQRGRIPPNDFIPAAEETGLIVPLGQWVLREACKAARAWNDGPARRDGISVSVNLSGKQLVQPDLIDQVRGALDETGLEAGLLRLEVTESVIMENAGPAALCLTQLKNLQVHLLLDDFGTGYSSLSYLHNFRFDTLKIDRSFVARIEQAGKNAEIVRTIVSLARALGMDVVAEGVEQAGQVAQLQVLHVDSAQGFYFSKPVEADAFQTLLAARRVWPLPLANAGSLARTHR